MKKIKLVKNTEKLVLSRDELKLIYGGSGSKDSSKCNNFCNTSSECGGTCAKCTDIPNWAGSKVCSIN